MVFAQEVVIVIHVPLVGGYPQIPRLVHKGSQTGVRRRSEDGGLAERQRRPTQDRAM